MNGQIRDSFRLVPVDPKLDVVLEGQTLRLAAWSRSLIARWVEKAFALPAQVEALGTDRLRRRRCCRDAAEVVVVDVKVGVDPSLNKG